MSLFAGLFLLSGAAGLVFTISFAILLVPTTLMGMTLPLLAQSFVRRVETSGSVIGILYGINTLSAACGAGLLGDQEDILEDQENKPYLTDLKPWLEYYLFRKPIR